MGPYDVSFSPLKAYTIYVLKVEKFTSSFVDISNIKRGKTEVIIMREYEVLLRINCVVVGMAIGGDLLFRSHCDDVACIFTAR